MASKIVVIGNVNGQFTEVFGKLAGLHAKQNFAFAIIAGELFDTGGNNTQLNDLLDGKITVPLPTYFALGKKSLPQEVITKLETSQGELCTNLSILGRRVSIKTSEGFKIIAVGGQYVASYDAATSSYDPSYSTLDTEAVAKGLNEVGADILITSDWPASIQDGSKNEYTGASPHGVQTISDLCTAVKPRYHFSTSPNFYEREPFFHHVPPPRPVTRFISLAPYGNPAKQKWIYAFSLEPSADPPQHLPPGTTATPFRQRKRRLEAEENGGNNFRYSNGNANGGAHYERDNGRRKRGKFQHQAPPTPDQCFFCLSNPACETHMIASIGNDVYLTTSKGPLTESTTFPDLGFPGHVLLIPLVHAPTISAIADPAARRNTINEMQKYRTALQNMLISRSKDESGKAKLGAVTWEISRTGGVHHHWQFLPVPISLLSEKRNLVEAAFDVEAENASYPPFSKTSKAIEEVEEEGDFFKVMIWSEANRKEMVLPLDGTFRFDFQFGRRVMGKLMGLEGRTHWRDALQGEEVEKVEAGRLKEAFKEFDFSLEGDE